jgi:hypothetical protein
MTRTGGRGGRGNAVKDFFCLKIGYLRDLCSDRRNFGARETGQNPQITAIKSLTALGEGDTRAGDDGDGLGRTAHLGAARGEGVASAADLDAALAVGYALPGQEPPSDRNEALAIRIVHLLIAADERRIERRKMIPGRGRGVRETRVCTWPVRGILPCRSADLNSQ